MRRGWVLSIAFLGFLIFGLVSAWSQSSPPPAAQANFVGDEACQECHESEYKEFKAGSHGRAAHDSVVVAQALHCETCHGPGSAHVEADNDRENPGFATMRRFDKMQPSEANAFCMQCHSGGEQFYWQHSSHATEGVACVTCHSMHAPKDPGHQAMLKKADTNELCMGCHKMKRAALARSAHMPLIEGGMNCADCHNPHGSPTPHQLRAASTNELCTSCHMDKRGPFLWEHPPVRENCVTCHEPHGANNDKVLTGKRPFLCQRCHIGTRHPSTLYDFPDLASNRLFNRSCTNCHTQIHGSNHPSGKFYLR